MKVEGKVLAGRYRLAEQLGEGGMSEVYRARDLRIGRWVAVKLLRTELVHDPAFEGRLRREAQSAASLHSPSIVAVYDVGEEQLDGKLTPYIVMELIDGRTLRDLLAVDARMPVREAVGVTAAICTALDEAHRAGIVHRDVKPGNVMVTTSGDVKVMDFGIAQATASAATMTQDAAVTGTAHYLSPEQARGEHVDARSDIYSTGCLLYELLTGSPPFTGDTAVAIAYQHVREDPVQPSLLTADITPDLDAVVLKSLAKNPINRYQSAGALRADLNNILAGQPVSAAPPLEAAQLGVTQPPPTTVLVRDSPKRRRHGVAYTILALAVVAVFIVALSIARSLLSNTQNDLETPSVVKESYTNAQTELRSAGLKVGAVTYRYDSQLPYGEVISQDPSHPILLNRGESVGLVLSRGTKMASVPTDIIGAQEATAVAELKAAGFQIGKTVPVNSTLPAGQIISVSPVPGDTVPYGSSVILTISNAMQTVPSVLGLPAARASAKLQRAGFAVIEKYSTTYEMDVPIGQVVDQTPEGGDPTSIDTTIQIFVNEPPAKPTKSPGTSPSTPPATGATTPAATTTSP